MKTITSNNIEWRVRNGKEGVDTQPYSESNVSTLHNNKVIRLKLSKQNNIWTSAGIQGPLIELNTKYKVKIFSRLDSIDPFTCAAFWTKNETTREELGIEFMHEGFDANSPKRGIVYYYPPKSAVLGWTMQPISYILATSAVEYTFEISISEKGSINFSGTKTFLDINYNIKNIVMFDFYQNLLSYEHRLNLDFWIREPRNNLKYPFCCLKSVDRGPMYIDVSCEKITL